MRKLENTKPKVFFYTPFNSRMKYNFYFFQFSLTIFFFSERESQFCFFRLCRRNLRNHHYTSGLWTNSGYYWMGGTISFLCLCPWLSSSLSLSPYLSLHSYPLGPFVTSITSLWTLLDGRFHIFVFKLYFSLCLNMSLLLSISLSALKWLRHLLIHYNIVSLWTPFDGRSVCILYLSLSPFFPSPFLHTHMFALSHTLTFVSHICTVSVISAAAAAWICRNYAETRTWTDWLLSLLASYTDIPFKVQGFQF